MKKFTIIIILFFYFVAAFSQENKTQKFYVGTFTNAGAEGMYLCSLNTETSEIQLEKTFKAMDDPTYFKISDDKKFLYAACRETEQIEKSGGYIVAYKIEENGSLHFLNKQISNGKDPCFIDVSKDGKYVATATYVGGTVSVYKTDNEGKLTPATSTIKYEGASIVSGRQDNSHAHSIKFSPYSNQVYSADLGTDRFNIFYLNNNELFYTNQEYIKLTPGAGPRHFAFHPDRETIFIINELNSTITCINKHGDSWEEFQTISTLPPGFKGTSYSADIHISNDGRFLYASNRGDNSIAIFVIESTKKRLLFVGTISTEGDWPRNFTISPDGKFMLVANQNSGNITVFKVDPKSGMPEFTGKQIKIPSPVCLEFL